MTDERKLGPRYRVMPGWVSVKPREQQIETTYGLYVPKNEARREITGTVIAVGQPLVDGKGNVLQLVDCDGRYVVPGDTVLYLRHAGSAFTEGEEVELILLKFTDIIARIADDDEVDPNSLDADVRGNRQHTLPPNKLGERGLDL